MEASITEYVFAKFISGSRGGCLARPWILILYYVTWFALIQQECPQWRVAKDLNFQNSIFKLNVLVFRTAITVVFCLINQLPSLQRSAPRNLSEMWWWLGLASAKPAWVSRWRVHFPMWGPPFGSLSISKPVLWWFFRLLSNFRILSGL